MPRVFRTWTALLGAGRAGRFGGQVVGVVTADQTICLPRLWGVLGAVPGQVWRALLPRLDRGPSDPGANLTQAADGSAVTAENPVLSSTSKPERRADRGAWGAIGQREVERLIVGDLYNSQRLKEISKFC